jgi:hypothetical protein
VGGIDWNGRSIGLSAGSSTIWFRTCSGTSRSVTRGGVIPVSTPFSRSAIV